MSCPEPVMVVKVDEAEMDEMWSFVQSKKQQRWLWLAIDHRGGKGCVSPSLEKNTLQLVIEVSTPMR
ncbi:hypothetical protein H6F68_01165 [Trichocoleus sp. FACHB-262]|nr:IS1 family transposase [Trichocoleus sp. FACHB-262]MBD2119523.1 hypothetical protein [Trichocoleus sp. FACHB-262]